MTDGLPNCRFATESDISQVVEVHIQAFPGFFLTTLGPAFLRAMYRAFLLNAGTIFVVDEIKGKIQGFAVGLAQASGSDARMALRARPPMALALVPALLRNPLPVARRIAGQLISSGGQPEAACDSAVLRSIGVLPEAKGGGSAGRLLEAFERMAGERGASTIALTTDAEGNERAIAFYQKNGYAVYREFLQHGFRRMLLMVKQLNPIK